MAENGIYDFMVKNELTTKSKGDFMEEYSSPEKAQELYDFFKTNELTSKDYDAFYSDNLKKKDGITKPTPISPLMESDGQSTEKVNGFPITITDPSDPSVIADKARVEVAQARKNQQNYINEAQEASLESINRGEDYFDFDDEQIKVMKDQVRADAKEQDVEIGTREIEGIFDFYKKQSIGQAAQENYTKMYETIKKQQKLPQSAFTPLAGIEDEEIPKYIEGEMDKVTLNIFTPTENEMFDLIQQRKEETDNEKIKVLNENIQNLSEVKELYDPVTQKFKSPTTEEDNERIAKINDLTTQYSQEPFESLKQRYYETALTYDKLKKDVETEKGDIRTTLKETLEKEGRMAGAIQASGGDIAKDLNQKQKRLDGLRDNLHAIGKAYLLNQDPGGVERGFWEQFRASAEKGFKGTTFMQPFKTLFEQEELGATEFIKSYAEIANSLTDEQKEKAKDSFSDKVAQTTGQTLPIMGEIAAWTVLSSGIGAEAGLAKASTLIGSKYGKLAQGVFNVTSGAARSGAIFELSGAGGVTGVGESLGEQAFAKVFSKYGGLVTKLSGRTLGATLGEYTGEFLQTAADNGWDLSDATDIAIGDDPLEKLLLTLTATAMYGGGSSAMDILRAGRDYLGTQPQTEKVKETVKVINQKLEDEAETKTEEQREEKPKEGVSAEEQIIEDAVQEDTGKTLEPVKTEEARKEPVKEKITKPKTEEDAIQERETKEVPIRKQTKVSEEVDKKVRVKSEAVKTEKAEEEKVTPKYKEVAKARANQKKLINAEPTSVEDAVMQHFASGKRISTEDFRKETGFGSTGKEGKFRGMEEFRKRIWVHGEEGQSIDKMAMQIVEENPSLPATTEEVRGVIIDVLTSNETKSDMFNKLAETFEVEGEIYSDAAEAQQARIEGDYSRAYEEVINDPYFTDEQAEQITENAEYINQSLKESLEKELSLEQQQEYEKEYDTWWEGLTEEEKEQEVTRIESLQGTDDVTTEDGAKGTKDTTDEQKAVKPTYKNLSTELTKLEEGKSPVSIGKQIASSENLSVEQRTELIQQLKVKQLAYRNKQEGLEKSVEQTIADNKNPEKDITPIFSLASKSLSIAIPMIERGKKWLVKNMRDRGFMPLEAYMRKLRMDAKTRAHIKEMDYNVKDFQKAFKSEYEGNIIKRQFVPKNVADLDLVNKVLRGEEPLTSLKPKTQEVVSKMRDQIDGISQLLIKEGLLSGDMQGIVQDNLGLYLNRSYRIHDDPKYWEEFIKHTPEGQSIRNQAVDFVRKESQGSTLTDKDIDGIIDELLYLPDAPLSILGKGKIGKRNLSILKQRKDIAPPIRALLGEYGDPLVNYARSVAKSASLLESSRFLQDIKDMGLGKFLFDKPIKGHGAQIAAEGNKALMPLDGLYTTPEIKEAFDGYQKGIKSSGALLQYYSTINAWVKYGKTIGSPQTHVRNFLGNIGFTVTQGHWRVTKFQEAFTASMGDLFNIKKWRGRFNTYVELGVVGDAARAGEIHDIVKDALGKEDFIESYSNNILKKIKNKTLKGAEKVYALSDDFWKIYGFENEVSRYKKAFPEWTEAAVQRKAAEIVTNTYPTYSRVPPIIKELRRIILVGPFVSFPAEVMRTTINTMSLIKEELGDKRTKDIAIQRMTGALLTATVTGAISMITAMKNGIDDDEKEAWYEFMPPWSKHGQIVFLNVKDGKLRYVDMGSSDPHNYLKKPIVALMRGENTIEATSEGVREFLDPFLSEEILFQRLRQIASNKKINGKPIYTPDDPSAWKDVSKFLIEGLQPGIVGTTEKIWKGVKGEKTPFKEYSAKDEILSVTTGQRISTIDVRVASYFRLSDVKTRIKEVNKMTTRIKYAKDDKEKTDLQKRQANAYKDIFEDYKKLRKSAITLGVTPSEWEKLRKSLRIKFPGE